MVARLLRIKIKLLLCKQQKLKFLPKMTTKRILSKGKTSNNALLMKFNGRWSLSDGLSTVIAMITEKVDKLMVSSIGAGNSAPCLKIYRTVLSSPDMVL